MEIYTPLDVAKNEILHRWKDHNLRKRVEDYLGGEVPAPFENEPRAVLSRSLITPNREFFCFIDLATEAQLKPLGLQGVEDKYCTKNYDKVSLGKLSFYEESKGGNAQTADSPKHATRIIDSMSSEGKRICDIDTFWGESLTDFHCRMLSLYGAECETFDDFKWFSDRGRRNNPLQYYNYFLAFFLSHGILFDNFHAKGKEEAFTKNVVMKSFKRVYETFQLKPLIVPLVPVQHETHLSYWNGYTLRQR